MKNKILATIDDCYNIDNEYLDYLANLSKDFHLDLTLIANTTKLAPRFQPTAVIGAGLNQPHGILELKVLNAKKEKLETAIKNVSHINPKIKYDLNFGALEMRIENEELKNEALLWTLNLKSNSGLFNELLGTSETYISKETNLPCLNIPKGYEYKKPKKILVVLRNIKEANLDQIENLINKLNLDTSYVIHQDDDISSLSEISEYLDESFSNFKGKIHSVSFDLNQEEINKIIDDDNSDLVAYVNYNATLLERFFKPSTNSLILNTDRPTLVI